MSDIVLKQFPQKTYLSAKVKHDFEFLTTNHETKKDYNNLQATLKASGEHVNGIGYLNFLLKGLDHEKDITKGHLMLSTSRNRGIGVYITEDINNRGIMEIGVIKFEI